MAIKDDDYLLVLNINKDKFIILIYSIFSIVALSLTLFIVIYLCNFFIGNVILRVISILWFSFFVSLLFVVFSDFTVIKNEED